jgi:hypothetical protein
MCQHIGFPDWIKNVTGSLFIFEGNGKGEDRMAMSKIADWFEHFEERWIQPRRLAHASLFGIAG